MTMLREVPNEEIPTPDDQYVAPPTLVDPVEASLLGAMLFSVKAIDSALLLGIEPAAFVTRGYGFVFEAITELHAAGEQADPVTVIRQLGNNTHGIDGPHLTGLVTNCPTASSAPTYAQRIHDRWTQDRAKWALADAVEKIKEGENPRTVIANISDRLPADNAVGTNPRAIDGATFLLDQNQALKPIWGAGDTNLWAEGEPLMIVGPTGIGKTTIGQQVVLGRLGLRNEVLGQPVTPANHRCLYLACDRPNQARRSMQRMVDEHDRDILEDMLTFWTGPLPFSVVEDPAALTRFARQYAADTIVVDSLKDICHKLSDDEHGSKTNAALQELVASGIEVIVLHHQRKQGPGAKKEGPPKSIDDVYGSTWITAGMGSVLLVWGQPGDPLVDFSHLKSPAEQIGPWTIRMDFDLGYSTVEEEANPLKIVASAGRGASVNLVARVMYKTEEPTKNEQEKARRRLDKLVAQGLIHREEVPTEGGGKPTAMYFPIDTRRTA